MKLSDFNVLPKKKEAGLRLSLDEHCRSVVKRNLSEINRIRSLMKQEGNRLGLAGHAKGLPCHLSSLPL